MTSALSTRVDELTATGVPFVQATVVRAQEPSSARPGDRAIILADGSMEGFVGGHCAAGSVRTAALDALGSGESLLLRVLPGGDDAFPESPGASVVVNPCLSGGALEIYLQPLLPRPLLRLLGGSPVADAVAEQAGLLGFEVDRGESEGLLRAPTVVVVSTHGGDEVGAVRAALDAGVGFVGVVCSRTRGETLLADLELTEPEAACVHVHVGLDIGARTAAEVGLSIMAAVVRGIRLDGLRAPVRSEPVTQVPAQVSASVSAPVPRQAVDPVCGMTVTVGPATPHATVEGVDHWFCNPGCRDHLLAGQA